jgi:signal transduction histidine kinase
MKGMPTSVLALIIWLGCAGAVLTGQEQPLTVPTQYYSLNEGLSDRLITDIMQGADGHIWIATSNGLNKFDGYEFVVFNNSPDNLHQLSYFYIDQLLPAKNGHIAIVYHTKLSFFDLLDPTTHQVKKVNTLPETGIMGIVRQITVNKDSAVLVLTIGSEGTYLYRYQDNGHFKPVFQIKEKHNSTTAAAQILHLQNGQYLLNDSEKGLRLLDARGNVLKRYRAQDFKVPPDQEAYPGNLYFLRQDRQGRVWLAWQKSVGVYQWSATLPEIRLFDKLPRLRHYTNIWEDKAGNLLFAQTNGDIPFPKNEQFFCLKTNGSIVDFSYLTRLGPYIQCVYSEDFFKTIFFGIDTGLKIAQNNYARLTTLLSRALNADQRGHILRGITGNDRTVYFAEESGAWYALDLATDTWQPMALYDKKTGNPLELNCSLDLHLDAQNRLWGISCNELGEGMLLQCDPATGATNVYRYSHPFKAMNPAADGTFWLLAEFAGGNKTELLHFYPSSGRFSVYKDHEKTNPIKDTAPWFVFESKDGIVWVGTSSGLVRIDRWKKFSRTYTMESTVHGKGLKSNSIYCIHEDPAGNLWLGTNNGLSILNPTDNTIVTYDRQDGLASNTVCGIVPDEKGNYWISTYNGLSYFEVQKKEFHNFYQADGLSHDEFNRFSYYRDVNNRYYFGGVNGLNIFRANDLLVSADIGSVVFTKLTRFDTQKDTLITCYNCLTSNQPITIYPSDSYFQINFMLPQFANPSKNQFLVKLEGYENKWTRLDNTPFIRYSRLPPGNYTLLVRGADPNGNWSRQEARLPIEVKRTFFQTPWFYLILIGVAIFTAYVVSRYQLEQKLEVERFRIRLSNDLHDELSGLLSGIAMQTDMLQMSSQDSTLNARLRHIGEVSRKAMSKMNDVIWSIDSRKDRLEDLIKRMHEHADDILLPLGIQYFFNIKRLELQQRIPPTIRQELYLIFKEAVNNVAKHSNASRVTVTMSMTDGIFCLEIQDNGEGLLRQHNGHTPHSSGQGLSSMKMRAQRINAKVEIIKEDGYTIRLRMRRLYLKLRN